MAIAPGRYNATMRDLIANAAIVTLTVAYAALSLVLGWENVRTWWRSRPKK